MYVLSTDSTYVHVDIKTDKFMTMSLCTPKMVNNIAMTIVINSNTVTTYLVLGERATAELGGPMNNPP
jgi:hypothetical protein